MEPSNWNIVILGAWNRAILTPAWISRTVFARDPTALVNVLVPLDGLTSFQVEDQGVTVLPKPGQLIVSMSTPTEANLTRALEASQRAILDLPRTPFEACGINLRYTAPDPPHALVDRTRCPTERILVESGREIRIRRRGESLGFQEGALNVIADIPTVGICEVNCNFERRSTNHDELVAWLRRPAHDYLQEAAHIIGLITEETNG